MTEGLTQYIYKRLRDKLPQEVAWGLTPQDLDNLVNELSNVELLGYVEDFIEANYQRGGLQ